MRKRDRGWCAGGRYICILSKHSIGLSWVSLSSSTHWQIYGLPLCMCVYACVCICVGAGRINWERETQGTGEREYVSGGEGRQANSSHVAFHRYHNPLLPVSAIFHLSSLPLSFPLLSPPLFLSLCLIILFFTWCSWPFHCSAGSQAVKPSQEEGCKSVSPSQEISWSSADSTKPSWGGGPNVSYARTGLYRPRKKEYIHIEKISMCAYIYSHMLGLV